MVALTVTHADCEEVADRIGGRLAEQGVLGGPVLTEPGWTRVYSAGDRIVLHDQLQLADRGRPAACMQRAIDQRGRANYRSPRADRYWHEQLDAQGRLGRLRPGARHRRDQGGRSNQQNLQLAVEQAERCRERVAQLGSTPKRPGLHGRVAELDYELDRDWVDTARGTGRRSGCLRIAPTEVGPAGAWPRQQHERLGAEHRTKRGRAVIGPVSAPRFDWAAACLVPRPRWEEGLPADAGCLGWWADYSWGAVAVQRWLELLMAKVPTRGDHGRQAGPP